jgi:hypothetical protein
VRAVHRASELLAARVPAPGGADGRDP